MCKKTCPDNTNHFLTIEELIQTRKQFLRCVGNPSLYGELTKALSEQKRTEAELRATQFCLDTCYLSIFWIKQDGSFAYVNDAACKKLGYNREELLNLPLWEIDPDYIKTKNQKCWEYVQNSNGIVFEARHKTKEGHIFPVEISANPMRYGDVKLNITMVRDISERKQAQNRLLEYQNKLRALARTLTDTEERLKQRTAEQLHDQVGQSLAFSKMKLQVLSEALNDPEAQKDLQSVCQTLTQTISDIRSLTFQLSSPVLSVLGLEKAVTAWLRDHIEQEFDIKTEFVDDGSSKPLDTQMKIMLFRSIRELLINAVKYADASLITVSISRQDHLIHVCVKDDGKGFHPKPMDEASSESGFGLFSIRERLEHFGGSLVVDSKPGQGCRATLIAPLAL